MYVTDSAPLTDCGDIVRHYSRMTQNNRRKRKKRPKPCMTLRNNTLDLNAVEIYIYDLLDFWGESGAAEQVWIENNRFDSSGMHSIEIGSCRPESANRLHGSVTIRNNRFVKAREDALKISAAGELVMEDNLFAASSL